MRLGNGRRCPLTEPTHLLFQPEPHADEPLEGGVGVDEDVEGSIVLAVALGLPRADRVPAPKAGDDGFFAPIDAMRSFAAPMPNVG